MKSITELAHDLSDEDIQQKVQRDIKGTEISVYLDRIEQRHKSLAKGGKKDYKQKMTK